MNSKFLNKLDEIKNDPNFDTKKSKLIKDDILRYSPNKLSFWLCMLSIVANIAMFIIIYTEKNCTANWQLGIDLLVNVIFLLACFLLSEKTKAYRVDSAKACFVIAGIQILRIFWIPLFYYSKHLEYLEAVKAASEAGTDLAYSGIIGLSGGKFIACIVLFIISACALVGAGVVCTVKARKLNAHLKELEKVGDK
jgi:hypothetical protein